MPLTLDGLGIDPGFDFDEPSPWGQATRLLPLELASVNDTELNFLSTIARHMAEVRQSSSVGAEKNALVEVDGWFPGGPRPPTQRAARGRPSKRARSTVWPGILVERLRLAVATATHLNGRPMSAARLAVEREDLRLFLVVLIERDLGDAETRAEVERFFAERLPRASLAMTVKPSKDGARLLLRAVDGNRDLGHHDTVALVELLGEFGLGAVRRCRLDSCGRFYIAGADTRSRTRGVMFCSDRCKRAWNNEQRKRRA